MEIDADIDVLASRLAERGERIGGLLDLAWRGHDAQPRRVQHARLEGGEAFLLPLFNGVRAAAHVGIDPHAVARRAAEQLVDRHAQRLALDVPQGLLDAAQGAGEDRSAAIKGMAIDGLPMVHHLPRILADQVGGDLLHGDGARLCPSFEDRLAPDRRCLHRCAF